MQRPKCPKCEQPFAIVQKKAGVRYFGCRPCKVRGGKVGAEVIQSITYRRRMSVPPVTSCHDEIKEAITCCSKSTKWQR